jgi:hypothetical protein
MRQKKYFVENPLTNLFLIFLGIGFLVGVAWGISLFF